MSAPTFPTRPDADLAEAVAHGERLRAALADRLSELEADAVRLWVFTLAHTGQTAAQIAQADAALNAGGKIVATLRAGNYSSREWCGACFHENWMFVNIQAPGITFAITGPWETGAL